jgi:hypothetical protein
MELYLEAVQVVSIRVRLDGAHDAFFDVSADLIRQFQVPGSEIEMHAADRCITRARRNGRQRAAARWARADGE